jgi:hypothetical protein
MAFMRAYGMGMMGDPRPKPAPKRKSAAAGPRAKAGRKRVVRAKRAARGGSTGNTSARGGLDFGAIAGKLAGGIPFVGGAAEELTGQLMHKGKSAGAAGGHRRRVNPANVRALKRSLRRVEGFGHLVKRVNALLPRAHKFQVHPVMKHKRRKRAS